MAASTGGSSGRGCGCTSTPPSRGFDPTYWMPSARHTKVEVDRIEVRLGDS
jgi:homoserine trans-succinylase